MNTIQDYLHIVLKSVAIGIFWATVTEILKVRKFTSILSFQHANGEIWVRFFDGTQLGIKSTAIKFIDQNGKHSRYVN